MAADTTNSPRTIKGLRPGLQFIAKEGVFQFSDSPKPISVSPSYLKTTAKPSAVLMKPRRLLKSFNVTLGGGLDGLVLPDAILADNAGTRAFTFDTKPYDGTEDSFYLESYTASVPSLTALGLKLDGLKLEFQDLSNHPDLVNQVKAAPGSWLGRVTLRGAALSIPSVPQLSLTPQVDGVDAFKADYSLNTGDLALNLSNAAYQSPALTLGLSNAQLSLSNASKDVTIKGTGTLSVPALGFDKLGASLDLKVVNAALDSLKGSITAQAPIAPLGLAGTLGLDYSFKTKAGTLSVQGGQLLGIGVDGQLQYGPQSLSGTLTLRNQGVTPKSLKIGALELTPLQGSVNLDYAWAGSSPGGSLKLQNLDFNLGLGGKSASFRGDVSLALIPKALPQLASASLQLTSDLDVNLGGFNVTLLASDPAAPTKFTVLNRNGSLVPSLSGTIAFRDLNGLTLAVGEGGLNYGPSGWSFTDGSLSLGSSVELGPLKLGPQASAQMKNGSLTINPDLSVNLDLFNQALKPVGQLVNDVVTPIATPIVKVFKTDIDLASNPKIQKGFAEIKSKKNVDLQKAWVGLVDYLEAVPGNAYKDQKLTAGELLDFVTYSAFQYVRKNPNTANLAFKKAFGTDLPSWLLELPQGIDYSKISLSANIARLESISKLAAALVNAPAGTGQWVPLPEAVFALPMNSATPSLSGGEDARKALDATLAQLSAQIDQLNTGQPAAATTTTAKVTKLPLQVDVGLKLPLKEQPVDTLLKMIAQKPFDLVRTDFKVSSGVEMNMAVPLAELATPVPQAYAILKAINPRLDLRAGLGAQLALSLGVSSTAPALLSMASAIKANPKQTTAELLKLFSGTDALTGQQKVGAFVGQTPGTPMLKLSPWLQTGLAIGNWGVDALVYGRLNGTVDVNLTSSDGSNRAYLKDVLTGVASWPGIQAKGSLDTELGLKIDTIFGGVNPKVNIPIVKGATLFNVPPKAQALLAMGPEPFASDVPTLGGRAAASALFARQGSVLALA